MAQELTYVPCPECGTFSKMRWPGFVAANAAGGLLWASFYTFGAYALGNAASSVGSTITIAGHAVASALTVTSIIEAFELI